MVQVRDSNLGTPYKPAAIYFRDADYVEYLREDTPCVQRRVDEHLTLALDIYSREIVGFRIKGFKNLYIRHLRKTQQVLDNDRFLSLVSVIEKTVEIVGHAVFESDRSRAAAYAEAQKVAREDNVVLSDETVMAA